MSTKIVCVSDTHGMGDMFSVPDGDILIHAGDLTMRGRSLEIIQVGQWLRKLPHKHKIIIPGNHDFLFEKDPVLARSHISEGFDGIKVLIAEGVEVEGLKIWGSPWTPRFYDWAFQLDAKKPAKEHWAKIPDNLDILITHGPPYGVLSKNSRGDECGDEALKARVDEINLRVHVFGHIHESYGIQVLGRGYDNAQATFINAAICNTMYDPENKPIVVEL